MLEIIFNYMSVLFSVLIILNNFGQLSDLVNNVTVCRECTEHGSILFQLGKILLAPWRVAYHLAPLQRSALVILIQSAVSISVWVG